MTITPHFHTLQAVVSDCARYRYWLRRHIALTSRKRLLFIMLNPSTADASLDDPTIRRVIGFARDHGAGEVGVVNLFALRSPDPKALAADAHPVGPDNDAYIEHALEWADAACAAWGAAIKSPKSLGALFTDRVAYVARKAAALTGGLQALGLTASGDPRHPLYLPRTARPIPFAPASLWP